MATIRLQPLLAMANIEPSLLQELQMQTEDDDMRHVVSSAALLLSPLQTMHNGMVPSYHLRV